MIPVGTQISTNPLEAFTPKLSLPPHWVVTLIGSRSPVTYILEFTPPEPTEVKSIHIRSTPSARLTPLHEGSDQFTPNSPWPLRLLSICPFPKAARPLGKVTSSN